MIVPTVGRVVWFYPVAGAGFNGSHPEKGEPIPAMVAKVFSDKLITVGGFDAEGRAFNAVEVELLQEQEAAPEGKSYAIWMPYQIATWMPYQIAAAVKYPVEVPKVGEVVHEGGMLESVKEFFTGHAVEEPSGAAPATTTESVAVESPQPE